MTLGFLSVLSSGAILPRRPRAGELTAVAGGPILTNACPILVCFGRDWRERLPDDGEIVHRLAFALKEFVPDLILGSWGVYGFWAVLIRRPSADPETVSRHDRTLRLWSAGTAVCPSLATQALYLWDPEA